MSLKSLIDNLPSYALDLQINLKRIFLDENKFLQQEELYSIALSLAYLLKDETLLKTMRAKAKILLDSDDIEACKIAALLMTMNNNFYSFKESLQDENLDKMESGLSMASLKTPKNQLRFEMACLAISSVNQCDYCIKIHKNKLSKRGVSDEQILEIARIASCLKAFSVALTLERMGSYDFILREGTFKD